jgi:hypothetical protein
MPSGIAPAGRAGCPFAVTVGISLSIGEPTLLLWNFVMCGASSTSTRANSPPLAVVIVRSGSPMSCARLSPLCVTGTMNGSAALTT